MYRDNKETIIGYIDMEDYRTYNRRLFILIKEYNEKNFLQLVKKQHKVTWPEGMWVEKRRSMLLNKEVVIYLRDLLNKRIDLDEILSGDEEDE